MSDTVGGHSWLSAVENLSTFVNTKESLSDQGYQPLLQEEHSDDENDQ